jgi:fumarate reductase subunit C
LPKGYQSDRVHRRSETRRIRRRLAGQTVTDQAASGTGGRREVWLFVIQRLSAMVLAPLVIVHLVTMVYVIQDGLTAAEILDRTRGSLLWDTIYSTFVVAAAVHAAIGLRTILGEMTPLRDGIRDIVALAFAAAILLLGFRAVAAVT